jgi:hypothetical protein
LMDIQISLVSHLATTEEFVFSLWYRDSYICHTYKPFLYKWQSQSNPTGFPDFIPLLAND